MLSESPTPVLDLSGQISDGSEQGLLGIACSPDGTKLYADHTNADGDERLVEYPLRGDVACFTRLSCSTLGSAHDRQTLLHGLPFDQLFGSPLLRRLQLVFHGQQIALERVHVTHELSFARLHVGSLGVELARARGSRVTRGDRRRDLGLDASVQCLTRGALCLAPTGRCFQRCNFRTHQAYTFTNGRQALIHKPQLLDQRIAFGKRQHHLPTCRLHARLRPRAFLEALRSGSRRAIAS